MNELKNSFLQVWQTISTTRKVSLIGSFVVVLAVLAGMIYFSSKPKLTLLYGGLAPTEASKIVEYLDGKKIPYELADGGATILVPSTQVYSTRLALAGQGIPRTSDTAGGVGFELFDKPSFGMSDFMQKANYYRALQGELARTIKQMDEVAEARVMIVVPEERLFSKDRRESKASVFVQLKPGRMFSPGQVHAIRFLVANGVEGLQPNRVAIVDSAGRALAEDDDSTGLNLTVNQRQLVKTTEEQLRDKAQSMLDMVLGPGQSVVRVSADLNFDAISQTSEKFDPKSAVVRSESITNENNSSTSSNGNSSAVGVTSNTQNSAQGASSSSNSTPTNSTKQEKESTTNQYEINRTVESRQQAVGDIKRLSLAVFVNMRPAAAGAQVTPRTPQEIKALEDIVKEAVGFSSPRQDSIKVQETQFADLFGNAAPASTTAVVAKEMDRWLPYVSQAFLVVLAVGILLYFRSIIRNAGETTQEVEEEFSALLSRIEREKPVEPKEQADKPKNPGHLGVEEMTRLVREHPTNTAQAIKEWMLEN